MTKKFTAEEVRAFRNITFAPSDPGYAITSVFADRIEADERVVPFGWVNFIGELSATKKNSDDRSVYLHPPAQAAQVDSEGKPLIEVTQEDANNYCRILSLLGLEEEGDPVAEVGLLIAARDAEPVAQGDDVCVPFEQLSELMRGLELGPASAYLSPHALYCIGRAIAFQAKEATHPHSPDAADSGRVTSVMVAQFKIAFHEHSTISTEYDGCIRAGLEAAAALAAQGQGEAVAKVRHFDYRGIARNGFSQEAQMLDGAPVLPDGTPLYTRPAATEPPASPAGVPDGVKFASPDAAGSAAKFLLERFEHRPCDSSGVSCCVRCSAVALSRWTLEALAAAPSAPEGDGGGE